MQQWKEHQENPHIVLFLKYLSMDESTSTPLFLCEYRSLASISIMTLSEGLQHESRKSAFFFCFFVVVVP